jgi:hypothetical protein
MIASSALTLHCQLRRSSLSLLRLSRRAHDTHLRLHLIVHAAIFASLALEALSVALLAAREYAALIDAVRAHASQQDRQTLQRLEAERAP